MTATNTLATPKSGIRYQAWLPGLKGRKAQIDHLQFVSLFSGCGGLDLGFERAGFSPCLALDIDEAAILTYQHNRGHVRALKKDLSLIEAGYVKARLEEMVPRPRPLGVVGGPPCQAFSMSNVHKRSDDPRARLPIAYASVLKELNKEEGLDFFLFENVFGLKHKLHAEQFQIFTKLFSSAGFRIFEAELNAQDFGVPQDRRRLFVVGINARKYPHAQFSFPIASSRAPKTVREAIGGLPSPAFFSRHLTPGSIPFHPNHWCMNPRSAKFDGRLKEGEIKGRPFRVLSWNAPSWTVAYGHREVHIHPSGMRRLSILEAMLLQGFPTEYELVGSLTAQIRLVSDAVPPPLAQVLAETIKRFLQENA